MKRKWDSLFCVQVPRSEALTILGSLVCFPNTYQEIPLLQSVPEASEVITGTKDVKVQCIDCVSSLAFYNSSYVVISSFIH